MYAPGMITTADQLIVGRVVWYIYGHLCRSTQKLVITSLPQTNNIGQFVYATHIVDGTPEKFMDMFYLHDFGVGANYNMNRLFETEQQALDFYDSPECTHYRNSTGHNECSFYWRDEHSFYTDRDY